MTCIRNRQMTDNGPDRHLGYVCKTNFLCKLTILTELEIDSFCCYSDFFCVNP